MKTYESLLASDPGNAPLALATGRAFLSYAFAFVQAPAQELPDSQVDEQGALRQRAKKLFLRGRDYALQGLESAAAGVPRRPGQGGPGSRAAAGAPRRRRLPLLGRRGMACGVFSADPFDFDLILTLPRAVALLQQVNDWDETYDGGAVHEIFISFYGSAPADLGGSEARARENFQRAVALSRGLRAGPYIALASSVSVKTQNAAEFRSLLEQALAVDVNADVPDRLVNIINQRRARWMLDHIDDYFLGEGDDS